MPEFSLEDNGWRGKETTYTSWFEGGMAEWDAICLPVAQKP